MLITALLDRRFSTHFDVFCWLATVSLIQKKPNNVATIRAESSNFVCEQALFRKVSITEQTTNLSLLGTFSCLLFRLLHFPHLILYLFLMPVLSTSHLAHAWQPKAWRAYALLILGCLVSAIGLVFFILPYGIVPGGIVGICQILNAFFPTVQVGTFALILQIPLLLIATKVLGGKLGMNTIVTVLVFPLLVNGISILAYPDSAALQALDPRSILGGWLNMSEDKIICALMGGVLLGIGAALVIRQNASTGGSDIIAMLIAKITRWRFSHCLVLVDGSVIVAGMLVLGCGWGLESTAAQNGKHSLLLSCYSLLTMVVSARSLSVMLNGLQNNKLVHIICNTEEERVLRHWILTTLQRTATRTSSRGLYSEEEKPLLLLLVSAQELPSVTEGIREIAPDSFVIITDAYEAYGLRWKELPEKNALNFS